MFETLQWIWALKYLEPSCSSHFPQTSSGGNQALRARVLGKQHIQSTVDTCLSYSAWLCRLIKPCEEFDGVPLCIVSWYRSKLRQFDVYLYSSKYEKLIFVLFGVLCFLYMCTGMHIFLLLGVLTLLIRALRGFHWEPWESWNHSLQSNYALEDTKFVGVGGEKEYKRVDSKT